MSGSSSTSAVVVLTTVGSSEHAQTLAEVLVDERLAACVQIVSRVESVYRWEGKIERASEWLLICKTTRGRYDALERAIRERHDYETPEILAVPAERGSRAYLDWVAAETAP